GLGVDLCEAFVKRPIAVGIAEIAGDVEQALGELLPLSGINGAAQLIAKLLIVPRFKRKPNDAKRLRQHSLVGQCQERGHQFAAGEVAASSENDHNARLGWANESASACIGHKLPLDSYVFVEVECQLPTA